MVGLARLLAWEKNFHSSPEFLFLHVVKQRFFKACVQMFLAFPCSRMLYGVFKSSVVYTPHEHLYNCTFIQLSN